MVRKGGRREDREIMEREKERGEKIWIKGRGEREGRERSKINRRQVIVLIS